MRRMSEKKRLIKKLRNEFEADKDMTMSDPDRIREISRSSRTAYQSRYRAERNGSMAWLIIRQIRYAGRIVWMCQAAFLVCIAFICRIFLRYRVVEVEMWEAILQYRFPEFLCIAAVMTAWSSVPFFYRSFRWKMEETEAVTRFSIPRLRLAQIIISGTGTVLMTAGIICAVLVQKLAGLYELGVYLILPLLVLGNFILYFLRKGRREWFLAECAAAGIVILCLFSGWSHESFREQIWISEYVVWILCGAVFCIWIGQFLKIGKEETERWNFV